MKISLIAAGLGFAASALGGTQLSGAAEQPAPGFTTTGTWGYSSLAGHEQGKASIWSNDPDAAAVWNPQLHSVAPVRLALWLVTHQGNTTQAKIEVVHNGKSDIVNVNMAEGAPRWLDLGKFDFAGSGAEYVRVSRATKGGNLRLSALKVEILDAQAATVWQTLLFDDLVPYDPGVLQKSAPQTLRAGPPHPEQWELTFSDDFNGDRLDTNVWKSARGESWGALQSARFPENAVVSNGLLRLVTRHEQRGGKVWTSASISTASFRQQYGYWESRYRYAAATGLNQAFWMHPGKTDKAKGFEIDVNEGHFPNEVNATLHQSGMESKSKRYLARYDLAADFHLYAAEWNEQEVIYYFDGQVIHRVPNTKAHLPTPVIYSTAVLPWAGPINLTLDGKSMDVDWVRVYRRKP
jgi:hypothetical protein